MLSDKDKRDIKKIAKRVSCCITTWTTATRPSNPQEGKMGYNLTTHTYEYWNGTEWRTISNTSQA